MTSEQLSKTKTVIVVLTNASTDYYFITSSVDYVMQYINDYRAFFESVDGSSIRINTQNAAVVELWSFDNWRKFVDDYQFAQITGIYNYS